MVASKTPRKKRVVRRPPKLWTSPWQTVTKPKPNIMIDTKVDRELVSGEKRGNLNAHQTDGLNFFKRKLDGISNRT